MKYPYMVYDGKTLYRAGEEVPEVKETASGTIAKEEEPKAATQPKKRGRPSTKSK